jgi:hypothetical protein
MAYTQKIFPPKVTFSFPPFDTIEVEIKNESPANQPGFRI